MKNMETREASINIRALRTQRDLIDKAAAMRNKTRSDFMLEAACHEAENVLLDQRLFQLSGADYDAFLTVHRENAYLIFSQKADHHATCLNYTFIINEANCVIGCSS